MPRRIVTMLISSILLLTPLYQLRWTILGIPTTWLELIIGILVIVCLLQTPGRFIDRCRWFITIEQGSVRLPTALFLLAITIAAVASPSTIAAFGIWKAYGIDAILAFYVVRWAIRFRMFSWNAFLNAAALLLIGITGVALFQWAHPDGMLVLGYRLFAITDPLWSDPGTFRATSVFPYPNAVGLIAAPLVVLLASQWAHRSSGMHALGFIAGIISIALAQSQGAMLAVVIGLVALLVLPHLKKRPLTALLIIAGTMMLVEPFIPFQSLLPKRTLLSSPSSLLRIEQYRETREVLLRQPIMGGGLANYKQAVAPFHNNKHSGIPFLYPHMFVLAAWSELGLFGLIAIIGVITVAVYNLMKNALNPITVGLLATWIALLVHGLVDVPYFKNDLSVLFWVLVALSSSQTIEV